MAASLASISAHKLFTFRVNPYNISWGYNLRTHLDDTYGGKVVQILGVDLTSLTLDSVAGSRADNRTGLKYIQDLARFWRDMSLWQQNTQQLATFSFPAKKYSLKVWALAMNFQNSVTNVDYPFTLTFQIQDDLTGSLKKGSMTDALKKMAIGIGYTHNDYNTPSNASETAYQAQLATMGVTGAPPGIPGNITAINGTDSSLNASQQAIAQIVIATAMANFSGQDGINAAIIGIMVALQESTLSNVMHGDAAGPSSIGLYQQMPGWGTLAQRTDPAQAAELFFTAHNGWGANGLKYATPSVNGAYVPWQTKDPWVAGSDVELVGDSGAAYRTQLAHAQSIVKNILGTNTAAIPSVVQGSGVQVIVPSVVDVLDASIRGGGIVAPTNAVAQGLRAGLAYLGTPYVWGGGDGAGSGPNNGVLNGGRGNHEKNSGGSLIGFDCSGLVGYVIHAMGFQANGTTSGDQNSGGQQIPFAQMVAGDVIGYSGHTAISLGKINGVDYLLEAPDVGSNVQVKAVYSGQSRRDTVARYWI